MTYFQSPCGIQYFLFTPHVRMAVMSSQRLESTHAGDFQDTMYMYLLTMPQTLEKVYVDIKYIVLTKYSVTTEWCTSRATRKWHVYVVTPCSVSLPTDTCFLEL